MRLLEKSQVNVQSQEQQRLEIDQGVQLAQRVTALREAQGREEEKLRLLREGALKNIQREIDEQINVKKLVESEISDQRKLLLELKKPLDKEWEEVQRVYDEAISIFNEAKKYLGGQKNKIADIDRLKVQIKEELNQAKITKQQAQELLATNQQIIKSSQDIKDDLVKDRLAFDRVREAIKSELTHRENKVAIRERDISNREKLLKAKEKTNTKNELYRRQY